MKILDLSSGLILNGGRHYEISLGIQLNQPLEEWEEMIVELESEIPERIISKPADAVLKGCDSWTVTSETVDGFLRSSQ